MPVVVVVDVAVDVTVVVDVVVVACVVVNVDVEVAVDVEVVIMVVGIQVLQVLAEGLCLYKIPLYISMVSIHSVG